MKTGLCWAALAALTCLATAAAQEPQPAAAPGANSTHSSDCGSCGLHGQLGGRAGHDRDSLRAYHPRPLYARSRTGDRAANTLAWNQQQMQTYPWHCDYAYWRWGVPTALVVPPTAAFQTEYNWGVAQTRSIPIYHQFGRPYAEGSSEGSFAPKPYWPSSTGQFGIYPVRAPY